MRRRVPLIVATVAALACLTAAGAPFLIGAARAGASYPKSFAVTDDAAASAGRSANQDRDHRLQILANLRAEPPEQPVVLFLGGSSARESTVDDDDWAAQIQSLGGPKVLAYNLGCKHDTFELDREVADLLPQDLPAIVYIGINIGRFCNPPAVPSITLPEPDFPPDVYYQHIYSVNKRIQSASLKRYYVKYWVTSRWPEFKAHYSYDIGVVETVVRACIDQGLHPVLVDLPRDLPIIGHSFEAPVAAYKAGCKSLSAKYHIPWLTFVSAAKLVNGDFFDIFHLVEPGRVKYQRLLSQNTVTLLHKYGLDEPAPTPTPTPTPTPSPTTAESPAP
jgi:hypothetical protein